MTTAVKKILIVDDEPSIVLSLEFLMKKAGYDVVTATDGNEGLERMASERPELVILDVNMPGCNGYEVCQAIRDNPEWKDTRIVMLTAKGRDVEREKGMAMGADSYVTKPFATKEVVALCEQLLNNG
jgi:DNA-binding response OmpR family regulator